MDLAYEASRPQAVGLGAGQYGARAVGDQSAVPHDPRTVLPFGHVPAAADGPSGFE